MSRSSHQRQQQQLLAQQQQQMADNDAAAAAAEMFDMFCLATTMRQILGLHRNMCDTVGLRPAPLNEFYPKLKAKIRSWKAQALWKKFDARASHRAYSKGNACTGTRVLVIGAGPCGLRTAIEAQLLGAKVVVLEKRDRISRNNVLHLWPFVITDLRNLGAKKFYGKFCAGSIDHISIRQLQCILLKVALLLGVEIHEGVSFESTIEPSEGCGWRAAISPVDHAVSHYEFDVLIGADGKRNTLEAFKRKEFRGKLAIAITANFINKKTEAEAKAEEISGVAFIFNQTFFKELYHTTGIDLENIVYYKDETHYFVMTAKKHSLIDKGVILQDFADPAELLAPPNVNTEKLLDYAREAAEFSTKYQMPNLEFAVNHYGKPDVAMFDFTSMFAAESSCRVIVRKNYRLMQCLVGDSLLEPFWPTGSGCARGFLSSMDAAYAIKLWNNPRNSTLGVVAQRESIYRLLAQTTPENLQRDIGSYTVDPATRYPNLNRTSVNVWQVKHLIDCDDKAILEQTFMDTNALQASQADTPVRRKRRTGDSLPLSAVLLRWIKAQLHSYDFTQNLNEVSDCFTNGKVLCALINRYRPDLVDFNSVKELPAAESNDLAFKILDKELNISRVMTGNDSIDLDKIDSKIWLNYLEQICEVFRGEIPHVKHPKLDVSELREKRNNAPDFSRLLQLTSRKAKSPMQEVAEVPHVVQRRSVLDEEKGKRQRKHEPGQAQVETPRRAKKRRSAEKTTNIEERQQRLKEIEANRQDRQSRRRMQRFQQTQNFYKSLHMLQVNTLLRESDESSPFEDYSIYMYRQQAPIFNDRVKELERKLLYPDRERGISSALPRGADEQFSDRIKSMEQRITSRNAYGTDKKPKDLMRAIGKIDSSDWNVREIEKKIEQSKKTETGGKGREKVPKWSKEQFVARQSKMSKPTRQDSGEEKFKEIDQTLKNLDKQLKEGSVLEVGERGKNKVASIAGQFVKKDDTSEEKNPPPIAKSNSKVALAFKKQAASEKCHFCKQTVYLMEKISTEGLILHRSCLKCHHCHTNLRLGGYAFDRDDPEGRFYCTQHFRLPAKAIRPVVRKPGQRKTTGHGSHAPGGADPKTQEKPRGIAENVVQLDLLDRGQTPERIEFENTDAMSDGEPSEEHIIDENEWSGRNFLQPSADTESDLSSSSDESDDDSDSDIFEEANGSPIAQQTLQLATDWIGKQHYSNVNSDDSDDDFYDSSEGLADDGKDDTEGEEIKKAREMRREEVRLLPLPTNLPTDTETEKQTQVVGPQDGVTVQKIDDVSSERVNRDAEKITLASRVSNETPPPSKADIEKIEQNSDRRFSADVDAISEKLYRLNNLMKMNKDIESMAKENLVKSDILKKLSLKEKWLLDNSVGSVIMSPNMGFPVPKVDEKVSGEVKEEQPKVPDVDVKVIQESAEPLNQVSSEKSLEIVTNGDDNRGDGLKLTSTEPSKSNETNLSEPATTLPQDNPSESEQKDNIPKMTTDKMEIEGILDIVKMLDTSYIEPSKEPLPEPEPSPKLRAKEDIGKMLYEAEHKNDNRLSDALRQIEVTNFAGTMDTIKSQMVTPTISHQGSLDISKYFPNAKQEKQSSAALNKSQKTLKDVDLTKYFPQSPVPQRKISVTTVADKLKKSQTEKTVAPVEEAPKAPPRRQKSMATGTDKTFSMREHLLDGAIDIQKAPVVKPVVKKGGIKIVKKIVPKGTKAKKPPLASKKTQDEADKILDEILHSGHEVRSPSVEYQKLFTEEKSPSEDISERIEKILEETGFDLGLPPKPKKKLLKTKSLGEEEFKRTQENLQSKEDGDRPTGVQKILQRFESMSSIKSDDSFKLKKTNLSSTCSSLNKSRESLKSKESLKSNSDSLSDLEKTMEYLKSEWKTEATNFLQKKRDSFYAHRDEKQAEAEAEAKRVVEPEPQWKHTKYSKFFGIKEKSPEKRKSPTKSIAKRKSPAKVLKKSPREEIMKHRKKVESVSSRTASFEEKIKAEEARLKAEELLKASSSRRSSIEGPSKLENGLGSKESSRRGSIDNLKTFVEDDKLKSQDSTNGLSKIPISQSRKDPPIPVELNRNLLDNAQKVLSRRGSASTGLADILKPPVIKGIRADKAKIESGSDDSILPSRRGSQDALKAVLALVRKGSQTSLNDKNEIEAEQNISIAKGSKKSTPSQSRRGSQADDALKTPVNQSKVSSRGGSKDDESDEINRKTSSLNDKNEIEAEQKISIAKGSKKSTPSQSRRGSQADDALKTPVNQSKVPSRGGSKDDESDEIHRKTSSRRGSKADDALKTPVNQSKVPSRGGSKDDESDEINRKTSSRRGSKAEAVIETSKRSSSRRGSQVETFEELAKRPERQVSPTEKLQKSPSRGESVDDVVKTPRIQSRKGSRTEEGVNINQDQKLSSPIESLAKTVKGGTMSPPIQSRRGSQDIVTNMPQKIERSSESQTQTKNELSRRDSEALEVPSAVSRRSSNVSEALDQTITIDDITDVDDIFNEIVNELVNDEDAPEEVKNLISSTVVREVELVAISNEEEDLEEGTHQVNEEFEKIAKHSRSPSAPKHRRASSVDSIEKLFSQFTDDMLVDVEFDSNDEVVAITPRAVVVNDDEEEEVERRITVEEAKLKFEPLFPRQAKPFTGSVSSSMSISPGRAGSKAKKVVQKLDPSNMAPSVQDMLQKIIPREDSEPNERIPVAFPRNYYESEEELSKSSSPKAQTPTQEAPANVDHLEVVYELAWPTRKRAPSPVPESARPPIKPLAVRESSTEARRRNSIEELNSPRRTSLENRSPSEVSELSARPEACSRKGSKSSIKEDLSIEREATIEEPTSRRASKTSINGDISPNIQRASPALLPTPRRGSRTSIDVESAENLASQPSSRRESKTSIKDDAVLVNLRADLNTQSDSTDIIPSPRRNSRNSTEAELPLNVREVTSSPVNTEKSPSRMESTQDTSRVCSDIQRDSPALIASPRKNSTEVESPPKDTQKIFSEQSSPRIGSDTSRAGSTVQRESPALIATPRKCSIQDETDLKIIEITTPPHTTKQSSSRRGSTSEASRESSINQRQSPPAPQIDGPTEQSFSRRVSTSDSSRESSNIQRDSPALLPTPRRGSRTSNEVELPIQSASRTGSKVSPPKQHQIQKVSKSPPKVDEITGSVNKIRESGQSSKSRSPLQKNTLSSKSPSPVPAPKPDSPLSSRDRVLSRNQTKERSIDWDMSKIPSSVRNSKEKIIEHPQPEREPLKEYKELLRTRLESPTIDRKPRNPSQSKERSLEWDMEQLPRSPMPRRKYVDMLLHGNEKVESPPNVPLSNASSPPNIPLSNASSPSPARALPDVPMSTKRLEEWEIIEQLERERRHALIKRDENYTNQVQEASSNNTQPKNAPRQPIPNINRLISLDEPKSSKLIEYIKQQTLGDSAKQKDDSPKSPVRQKTPQLSRKASTEDLTKQVEVLLKSKEPDSPKTLPRRQQLKKTESTEATYEDFARFTRKSVEKDEDTDEPELYETPTASISHHRYRQKSQESASGTYSPTSSLSKSIEHLAPSRPNRNKPITTTTLPDDKVDRETKYLIDRSKHLRNMKRDFMEEKIAGNNPYLKKVIEAQKISREPEEDEDEVDYALESYRPKNHTTPRFPTSNAISGRRRRENRYSDYTPTTSEYSRRPYSPHFSTASTTSSVGSRNIVDYFKRGPPHYNGRESSKDSCVQTDSESSSADDVELNSATEISTDSEFDHDEIIREAPKIFIDDTHLRKPTKVQIKQTVIAPTTGQTKYHINNRMVHSQQPAKREPQFKPLVQVDPSLLISNRMPLQNPRPGVYELNKTASTEGIASKKSLELKKRYLLGEQGNGNKIQKSGSTSILDSKIRSFHSNISECQKLLNPGNDISPSMKTFLDRTKLGGETQQGDKKIEIMIKKPSDEKENVFVNSKNELNKGMEYSETVNTTLVETMSKNKPSPIIETIDLISPEKIVPIIDLTQVDIPSKMVESNMEFINSLRFGTEDGNSRENILVPDNKIIDLTLESPVKSDKTVIEEVIEKPDVSKDVKEAIPDIITHIEEVKLEKKSLLDHETEKKDSPEKTECDLQETSIRVPNIPWGPKKCITESDSLSSSTSSSVEDIQHFILDSTTSPDTQTGQIVPRLEVHDSSGTLMQIDSLMIIDGKYIGDPEDLKDMEIPPGIIIPDVPTQSPSPEEPVTERRKDSPPPSPPQRPELKFDTKNENKIDTLKNIPLILEKSEDHSKVVKPVSLNITDSEKNSEEDNDKTPTAEVITRGSDSDAEITNQALTETELSDWTADDAISENFIDLEFVLNSNKGTIKRNKKKKKAPLQSALSITQEPEPEPEPEPCGILKNLDIEEIEFMDTGSEGSCAEAYSATNTALLRNRGYAEYTGSPRNFSHNHQRLPTEHELKTPVNESPPLPSTVLLPQKSQSQQSTPPKQSSPSQTQQTQSLSQSLTDSTNDIDEDSLCILTNSQGATANNTATITTTTTTEESEALTVVTSPMDSSSPKTQENFQMTASSSEQNGKTTSPSSNTTTATPATSSSSKGPTRKSSHEDLLSNGNTKRKESEEMSYEEYVRKLQQKITQISNARDSIDVRKQNRRKSSKGEASEANSVIEGSAKGLSVFEGGFSATVQPKVQLSTISVVASQSQDIHKVPEIPTLSSKLEELTKERTKQKDLIHDLVMDKLQSKKQLNAEKRLNRSRNRSMFGSNLTGSSLSPTPKMTSTNTSPYHITSSSGGDHSGSSCKENNPLVGVKTKMSPKEIKEVVSMFAEAPPRSAKQRPFSENFDPDSIDDQMCKLSKTQSFTYTGQRNFPFKYESNGSRNPLMSTVYATPLAPPRASRKDEAIVSAANAEKLRTEARARARLKSNHDLGLSPEEKLQLLRKRYHLDMQEATAEPVLKSEEMRARDRKMVSSKSVNDIATAQIMTLQPDENSNTTTVRSDLVADFTSDPNLSQVNKTTSVTANKVNVNRRHKDPERRKSIIQTFSSFFQKGKKDKDVGPISGIERSGTSNSGATNTGNSAEGMFSRFRISPKSKEKSKDKDNGSSPTTPAANTPQHRHHHDQRSNSQDCIAKQKYQMSSYASSPQLFKNTEEQIPPPIPPLPLNYQRSDDESYATESREQKKQRAISKATRQAELKRLRIAQEIQREQEEIEVQLKELEARGVLIEKALRGEGQTIDNLEASNMGANDEKLLKELLEIWRNITQLKKRDEELGIRQQELQLEHRHAQLKEELNIRLSGSKLEKSSADVAAEGAILNEMLEIVAKRAALRPTSLVTSPMTAGTIGTVGDVVGNGITFSGRQSSQIDESDI